MFGVYEGEIFALVFVSMRRNVQIFQVGTVRLGGNFMGAKLNKERKEAVAASKERTAAAEQ